MNQSESNYRGDGSSALASLEHDPNFFTQGMWPKFAIVLENKLADAKFKEEQTLLQLENEPLLKNQTLVEQQAANRTRARDASGDKFRNSFHGKITLASHRVSRCTLPTPDLNDMFKDYFEYLYLFRTQPQDTTKETINIKYKAKGKFTRGSRDKLTIHLLSCFYSGMRALTTELVPDRGTNPVGKVLKNQMLNAVGTVSDAILIAIDNLPIPGREELDKQISVLIQKRNGYLDTTLCAALSVYVTNPHQHTSFLTDLFNMNKTNIDTFVHSLDMRSETQNLLRDCLPDMISEFLENHFKKSSEQGDALKQELGRVWLSATDLQLLVNSYQNKAKEYLDGKVFQKIQNVLGETPLKTRPLQHAIKDKIEDYMSYGCLELSNYTAEHIMCFLIAARWFAVVFFGIPERLHNNHKVLYMSGEPHTGKSLIQNSLMAAFPSYMWKNHSQFQNPEIIHSAMLHIQELQQEDLTDERMKTVLDYQGGCQIDFKNKHNLFLTMQMPVTICSNYHFNAIMSPTGSFAKAKGTPTVEAYIRRCWSLPMTQKFTTTYISSKTDTPDMIENSADFTNLVKINTKLFNTILVLAYLQSGVNHVDLPDQGAYMTSEVYQLVSTLLIEFKRTLFGSVFAIAQNDIAEIVNKTVLATRGTGEICDVLSVEAVTIVMSHQCTNLLTTITRVEGKIENSECADLGVDQETISSMKAYLGKYRQDRFKFSNLITGSAISQTFNDISNRHYKTLLHNVHDALSKINPTILQSMDSVGEDSDNSFTFKDGDEKEIYEIIDDDKSVYCPETLIVPPGYRETNPCLNLTEIYGRNPFSSVKAPMKPLTPVPFLRTQLCMLVTKEETVQGDALVDRLFSEKVSWQQRATLEGEQAGNEDNTEPMDFLNKRPKRDQAQEEESKE